MDPTELEAYEALWSIVNPNGEASIEALAAVDFLKQSLLELDLLRTIWALSTSTNTLDKAQFFSVLRYISMAQNGIKDISKGAFCLCGDKSYIGTYTYGCACVFD